MLRARDKTSAASMSKISSTLVFVPPPEAVLWREGEAAADERAPRGEAAMLLLLNAPSVAPPFLPPLPLPLSRDCGSLRLMPAAVVDSAVVAAEVEGVEPETSPFEPLRVVLLSVHDSVVLLLLLLPFLCRRRGVGVGVLSSGGGAPLLLSPSFLGGRLTRWPAVFSLPLTAIIASLRRIWLRLRSASLI